MRKLRMKSLIIKVLVTLVVFAALSIASAANAGELNLPLQPGLYLREDVKHPGKGQRTFPTETFSLNAEGLSYPGCRCFETIQVHRQGNIYHLTQRCVLKGEDVLKTEMAIIIKNNTSFLLINDDAEQKWRKKKEMLYQYYGDPKIP